MRCIACNACLTDAEAVAKYDHSNIFIELCNKCTDDALFAGDIEYDDDLIDEEDEE